jgi:hypothetical protein
MNMRSDWVVLGAAFGYLALFLGRSLGGPTSRTGALTHQLAYCLCVIDSRVLHCLDVLRQRRARSAVRT